MGNLSEYICGPSLFSARSSISSQYDDVIQQINKSPESSQENSPLIDHLGRQKKINKNSFNFVSLIGRGTFGRVFLVNRKRTDDYYAMKVLPKKMVIERNSQKHALNEKRILAANKSPFLVQLKWSFQDDYKLFMVMEYIPGGELFSYLRRLKRFEESTAQFYAAEVVLALEYLHTEMNVIYRDLKPENLLITKNGHIKITDFGLSKNNEVSKTYCGTPEYLAPEIVKGDPYDSSVDLWCLGCLIFEMLAGYPPFTAKTRQGLFKGILSGKIMFKDHFSNEAKNLILRLLERKREKRIGVQQGFKEIKAHPWFKSINWDDVRNFKNNGPIIPKLKNIQDASCFDNNLTSQFPAPTPNHLMENLYGKFPKIEGFTHTNNSGLENCMTKKEVYYKLKGLKQNQDFIEGYT